MMPVSFLEHITVRNLSEALAKCFVSKVGDLLKIIAVGLLFLPAIFIYRRKGKTLS